MQVQVTAADGYALAADLYLPASPRLAALLAPALGVRRGFYRPLAEYLAEAGIAVLVPDYRGVGGSAPARLRGFAATLDDWAALDLPAALAAVQAAAPGAPAAWIGHSIGGQLLGLTPRPAVARALLVAAQHGHWRNWRGWRAAQMAALWWTVIPAATRLAGRLPMRALRQGEDVPAGVAAQWARWGRDPGYVVAHARGVPGSGFGSYAGALVAWAIADDWMAPPSTVRPLLDAFVAAQGAYEVAEPRALGVPALGHFGALRPGAERLWARWRDWLLA